MPGAEERGGRGVGPLRPHAREARGARRRRGAAKSGTLALIDAIFPESQDDPVAPQATRDVQGVLAGAVRDLARRTAATRVCAWLARPDGSPWPVAAHLRRGEPAVPDAETFARLLQLERASDLGERGLDPRIARFAARSELGAAVTFGPEGESGGLRAIGVIALGGDDDPPARVRPRTLAELETAARTIAGPLATAEAISRIARLDDEVRWLDRRAALGELVAEVVHEVRNPLVSVKTFLQLLPGRLDDREFLQDFRSVVIDEMGRLERLLDAVLRHAGPGGEESAHPSVGVATVVETTRQLLGHRARERRIRLESDLERPDLEVALSRDALRQILLNLTLNAIDATPAGGRVTLRARAVDAADGRWIEITVDDEGEGIPVADRERIFEAFHSTRGQRPGGLGLAITRRLAREGGGDVRAGDAPGGGARLSLRLPAAARLKSP